MPPKGSDCYALLLLLMMTAFPAAFSLWNLQTWFEQHPGAVTELLHKYIKHHYQPQPLVDLCLWGCLYGVDIRQAKRYRAGIMVSPSPPPPG